MIKDAWKGKGLGNQFLSIGTQSDALFHVVDVKLADKKRWILPDLILLKYGMTINDLAKEIHSDLTKVFFMVNI